MARFNRTRRRRHISKVEGERLASELRGEDLSQILIVPIEGGKRSHKSLMANALGEIIIEPFEFNNDFSGVTLLDQQVKKALRQVGGQRVIMGIEPTGHYVENMTHELLSRQYDIRQVNSLAVHRQREAGLTWCKTDELDLCAIGQLLLNGKGRAMDIENSLYYNFRQASRARRSSVKDRTRIEIQIHCYVDRLFPGLLTSDIFSSAFCTASLAFLETYGSAQKVKQAGVGRLYRWMSKQRIQEPEQKAAVLMKLAGSCLLLERSSQNALLQALRDRLEQRKLICKQVQSWEKIMAQYLVETPGIWLLAAQELGVVSAAEYSAELGPLALYKNGGHIISRAGLVPCQKQSATSDWRGGITKLGHPRLRYSLGVIANNLVRTNNYFRNFYLRLQEERGKHPSTARTAVACKFARISWAMMTLKGNFVCPSEDFNLDIEKKMKQFLTSLGALEFYRTQLGPRLRQTLEAGGYKKKVTIRLKSSARKAERAAKKAPLEPEPPSNTFVSIGEVINQLPVLADVVKKETKMR